MDNLELTVENILKTNKKTVAMDFRLTFKCERFDIDMDIKAHRLAGEKILENRYKEMYQSASGQRVIGKRVGYNHGTLSYFPAKQDEKGNWIANMEKPPVNEEITKVIVDTSTGNAAPKDTNKGLWFAKLMPFDASANWLIEDSYNLYSDKNADSCLKIYDYLMETKQAGVYRFNPHGTTYNGFLYPQRVNGSHFRLLLAVTRVRIDRPDIAPTMVISSPAVRDKERARIITIAAVEEV